MVLAVDVRNVWKRYGNTDVVIDLSFDVQPGEVLGFLGPNGSGKTTTMRMILDIVRPIRGEIEVFGGRPGVEHQDRVGYLPEDRGLYRDVKIIDTLTYFGALRGLPQAQARKRAMELLAQMGLADAAEKKAAELSRGMHQKAQLIATILNDPELLIATASCSSTRAGGCCTARSIGAMRYLIRDGATPQDLFRELASSGAHVEQFAVEAPSLDEVFIRTVAGDPRAEAVR